MTADCWPEAKIEAVTTIKSTVMRDIATSFKFLWSCCYDSFRREEVPEWNRIQPFALELRDNKLGRVSRLFCP